MNARSLFDDAPEVTGLCGCEQCQRLQQLLDSPEAYMTFDITKREREHVHKVRPLDLFCSLKLGLLGIYRARTCSWFRACSSFATQEIDILVEKHVLLARGCSSIMPRV